MSNLIELSIQSPDAGPMMAAEFALAAAEARVIAAASEFNVAADDLKALKRQAADLEATRKSLVAPIDEARTRAQALFKPPLDYLAKAEAIIKRKMLDYQAAERRLAEEAARREAERLRKLEEAKAVRAEKRGDTERAEDLRSEAQDIFVPTRPATSVAGVSTREIWSAELTDIKALCAAVVSGAAPAELVQFNQTAGNRLATALKGSVSYPGVRFVATESMAVRK